MEFQSHLPNIFSNIIQGFRSKSKILFISLRIDDLTDMAEMLLALNHFSLSYITHIEINIEHLSSYPNLFYFIDKLFNIYSALSKISLVMRPDKYSQSSKILGKIGRIVKSRLVYLEVLISLENSSGLFNRMYNCLKDQENETRLISCLQSFENINNLTLICNVSKSNIYNLHDIFEFALKAGIYIRFECEKLFYQELATGYYPISEYSFGEKYHLAIFFENLAFRYEKSRFQALTYQFLANQLMYAQPPYSILQPVGSYLNASIIIKIFINTSESNGFLSTNSSKNLIRSLLLNYTPAITLASALKSFVFFKLLNLEQEFRARMNRFGTNLMVLPYLQVATKFPELHTNKPRVLICGWYGTETLGDKAILGGIVRSFQAALGEIELHIASLKELYITRMTAYQMPELRDCTLHSVDEAINLSASMSLVVFGGGPLMAINQLAEMLVIFQKAVEANVPTLIAGCGVGPLGHTYHNEAIKSLLLLASHRIYRDYKSLELSKSLGIDTCNDQVAEDPAFTWIEFCVSELTSNKTILPLCSKPQTLILGLREWTYHEYAKELTDFEGNQIKNRFNEEIIAALELLLIYYPRLEIIPFPMCTNHMGGDDRWFYRDLFRGHTQLQNAIDFTYLGSEITPREAVKVFMSSSVALAMRFHSLVFALATGVPSVAVDYTLGRGKVRSLAEKHNVPYMSIDAITREFIFSSLSSILANEQNEYDFTFINKNLTFTNAVDSVASSLI
jgi:polysaccharide pyruvyl transferase WcaK-like protein